MEIETTRRTLISGVGLGATALAIPALAQAPAQLTPFRLAEARYRAAEKRFNTLPSGHERVDAAGYERIEQAYLATVREVDATPVADWAEFAAAYEIACDGGQSLPGEKLIFKLLADVRRLSGRASA